MVLSTDYADFRRLRERCRPNDDPGGVTAISRALSAAIPPVGGHEFVLDPDGVTAHEQLSLTGSRSAKPEGGTPPGCSSSNDRPGGIVRHWRTQPPANVWHPFEVHVHSEVTHRQTRSRPAGGTYWWRNCARVIVACVALLLSGCGDASSPPAAPPSAESVKPPHELRIAAAADLKFALVDLIAAFEKSHPDATITVTTGSSGNFFAQLTNEAPFDLFLSADVEYPRKLVEQGQGIKDSTFEYATGFIVLWAPKDSPLEIEGKGIEILRDESVKKIAIANPQHAPYGRAAMAALERLGVAEAVQPKLVKGQNIAETAQMVESGAADAGIIALSLAVSPALRDKGKYWRIPAGAHAPIIQGGVVLRWAEDASLANDFRAFLLSTGGQDILRQYGFEPAGE